MSVSKRARWTEEEASGLPMGEHDYFDRKSGRLLAEADFDSKLAKALSAFANSGGGYLLLGVENDGKFDGVDPVYKGKTSTREWLEQLCPNLVDYPLNDIRVHEVERSAPSVIPQSKVVIVIDVADSERAPHQSRRDRKYYVRIGGRSEPAPHQLIEDIRSRIRHPNVVAGMEIVGASVGGHGEQSPENVSLNIGMTLSNASNVKAQNVCVFTATDYGKLTYDEDLLGAVQPRANPGSSQVFWELKHPVYPGMETFFQFKYGFTAQARRLVPSALSYVVLGGERHIRDLKISWKLFADSAPAKAGAVGLGEMGIREKLQAVRKDFSG